jgi:hypothetical protein
LQQHVRADSGLMLIDCDKEEDAKTIQNLLEAAGFLAGVDYGVASCTRGVIIACIGIRFEISLGREVRARGATSWRPGPMPDAVARKFRQAQAEFDASRFALYCHVASAIDVDRAEIIAAGEAPTHAERVRRLIDAMRKSSSD